MLVTESIEGIGIIAAHGRDCVGPVAEYVGEMAQAVHAL